MIENATFKQFKPYSYYKNYPKKNPAQLDKTALIGSAAGVCAGFILGGALAKKFNNNTVKEVVQMLSMAGLANVFSVLSQKVDNTMTDKNKNKKWREAGFQVMNTTIPMVLVSSFIELSNRIKMLNNKPAKIIGSIIAMTSGACLATKITNIGKEKSQKRKYTIKDSVANFDDIVATIVIGFPQYEKLNKVAKTLLPFIYTYCGARAGSKE